MVLVLGGARSGKSTFAQEMAAARGGRVTYIATAGAGDPEMEARIRAHRASRPEHWRTLEAPAALAETLASCRGEAEVILVDCLTVYLSNFILGRLGPVDDGDPVIPAGLEESIMEETAKIIAAARALPALVILVANEAGQGVVPPYRLGRFFRDTAGRANQRFAKAADRVYLIQCGLAMELKSRAVQAAEAVDDLTPRQERGGTASPHPQGGG